MINNLIGKDILLMRKRYDEALRLRGIPCQYQYPILAETNTQGEPVIDSYSEKEDIAIFLDSNPSAKTFKRYGWVVENSDNLPMLIHCSWNLKHLQKDSIFRIAGLYTEVDARIFRVKELGYMMECPDHLTATVIPVYDETTLLGRTDKEIEKTFNKSNHFLKSDTTYYGEYHTVKTDTVKQL